MAKTMGEALRLLLGTGDFQITGIFMESNETVETRVNHKYREEMIVPFIGIADNISFMLSKGERYVITSDNVRCKVMECKEEHICELEGKINEIYGVDCWTFIRRWYQTKKNMDSLHFVHLKLKKV